MQSALLAWLPRGWVTPAPSTSSHSNGVVIPHWYSKFGMHEPNPHKSSHASYTHRSLSITMTW